MIIISNIYIFPLTRSNSFFNNEDISKSKLIHKLSDLQKSTRDIVTKTSDLELSDTDEIDITFILNNLRKSYYESDDYKFNDLLEVFKNNDYENNVISILSDTIENTNTWPVDVTDVQDIKKGMMHFLTFLDGENA